MDDNGKQIVSPSAFIAALEMEQWNLVSYRIFALQIVNAPSERKTTKDGAEYTEYRCEDAHEIVYREILKQSYYMFRLFNGTFQDNLIGEDSKQQINCLTTKLAKFYSKVRHMRHCSTTISPQKEYQAFYSPNEWIF